MPAIQAEHRNQASWASHRMDALLGTSWAWDEDDEHDAGAGPAALLEHERDPGPGAR
jgi:hypothetical protein